MTDQNTTTAPKPFPRSFWTANLTELFERGAYYAMASFVVIYLAQLGMGDYLPSTLNGVLWAIVYFLPILSGTIADQIGFKKSLMAAFVLLAIGYFTMGYPVWFGGMTLNETAESTNTAGASTIIPVIAAILLIGVGGSIIKPCISGTVQKTAGYVGRATLGFGIFYMVINIGSLVGRGVAFVVRTQYDLSHIFAVATVFSIIAFFTVLFFYTDPEKELGTIEKKPRKPVLKILKDMVLVLENKRFALFLAVSSGFFFLYAQVYNFIPLYLMKAVDPKAPMDVITMANPFVIVAFQLLITKAFGRWKPINSIVVGTVIIGLSMVVNVVPIFMSEGVLTSVPFYSIGFNFAPFSIDFAATIIPIAFLFAALTVGLVAFGELFTSARSYEYIGALAPKGQEGLFLGYANLPMAIGALIGGPAGAAIFNEITARNSVVGDNGLLQLDPFWDALGWSLLMVIGLASAFSIWLYNKWLQKLPDTAAN